MALGVLSSAWCKSVQIPINTPQASVPFSNKNSAMIDDMLNARRDC